MSPRGVLFALLLSAPGALAGNTALCIENTGGTCSTQGCAAWRGQTRCDTLRCFCTNSTCSGSDQVCYPQAERPYVQVGGQEYVIKNARWPDQFMFVRKVDGKVLTSTDRTSDAARWKLIQLPSANARDTPQFILYPVKYSGSNDASAMMVYKTRNDKGQITDTGAKCLYVQGAMGGVGGDFPVTSLIMNLWVAPEASPVKNQTLVMFSSLEYASDYLYLTTAGFDLGGSPVNVWTQDPGAGGYWYFEPPLPAHIVDGLRPFSGTRCSWSCGTVDPDGLPDKMSGKGLPWWGWAGIVVGVVACCGGVAGAACIFCGGQEGKSPTTRGVELLPEPETTAREEGVQLVPQPASTATTGYYVAPPQYVQAPLAPAYSAGPVYTYAAAPVAAYAPAPVSYAYVHVPASQPVLFHTRA